MGNKPVPNEIKSRRGTLRNDRVLTPSLKASLHQGDLPQPPEGLGEIGKQVWLQVLSEASTWVSYKLDIFLLGILCDQFEERATLSEMVACHPQEPRLRIALRELDRAIVSNLATLGLTPTDRARLGFVQVKSESKLEELMQRKNARFN
ncbi:MAG: hypothetical protein RLZZ138_494 [Actinomycetota bacterium]|jgi:hypothetical protein